MNFFLHVIINSRQPKKVDVSIEQALQILGANATIVKKENYWKEKSQTEVIFKLHINADESSSAIEKILNIIGGFSSQWNICVPSNTSCNLEDFSGVCDSKINILNIIWISFMLN